MWPGVLLTHLKRTEALAKCRQRLEFPSPSSGWFAKLVYVIPLNIAGASECDPVRAQKPGHLSWEGESPGSGP